jgi:hypothetical protein
VRVPPSTPAKFPYWTRLSEGQIAARRQRSPTCTHAQSPLGQRSRGRTKRRWVRRRRPRPLGYTYKFRRLPSWMRAPRSSSPLSQQGPFVCSHHHQYKSLLPYYSSYDEGDKKRFLPLDYLSFTTLKAFTTFHLNLSPLFLSLISIFLPSLCKCSLIHFSFSSHIRAHKM